MLEPAVKLSETAISVVIPSYNRGEVLLSTVQQLLSQHHPAAAIIIIDQTTYAAGDQYLQALQRLADQGQIEFVQRPTPSIPAAMNHGLRLARSEYVLFLDDDIEVSEDFIQAHLIALQEVREQRGHWPVAQVGQVLQPTETPKKWQRDPCRSRGIYRDLDFRFNSAARAQIYNCMAGNLCVQRDAALAVGGFDENFTGAAYRFETEFCRRLTRYANQPFEFTPAASIKHLQWHTGGTREHSHYLTSSSPTHSVGDYYFVLGEAKGVERAWYCLKRLLTSVTARFYLRRPWYLPVRWFAEFRGLILAISLRRKPAALLSERQAPKPRLAVFMSHATQHFAPVYRSIAGSNKVTLQVFYLSENGVQSYQDPGFGEQIQWDVPLLSGYSSEFLEPGKVLDEFNFFTMDSAHIAAALGEFKPDIIWLHGYGQRANWRAVFAKVSTTKVLYSSDSNANIPRGFVRQLAKSLIVRAFFKRCSKFLAVSAANRNYLRSYGVPAEQIIDTAFPIDTHRWRSARDSLSQHSKQQLAQQLGIKKGSKVLLFVGKLLARKRAVDAIDALAALDSRELMLVIVGSGPELAALKHHAKSLAVAEQTKFVGFKNQAELAAYFDLADLFIFPSSDEPYGAIAAEVLTFGLPIITAAGVGAIGSAILAGENGLVYPPGDIGLLSKAISLLLNDDQLRASYAKTSLDLAPSHDQSIMASDIVNYCQTVKC